MKHTKLLFASVALATLLLTPAQARQTPPDPAPAPVSLSMLPQGDQSYLARNAQGSVADYAMAQAGIALASDPKVQKYALMLVDDHNKLNTRLLMLAHDKKLMLPLTITDEDKTKLQTLMQKSGANFDRAFLQEEIQVNSDDVAEAQQELTTATDPDVKKLVSDFLKTEQKHLSEAQKLLTGMGGMPAPTTPAAPANPVTPPTPPVTPPTR